ncbi:MAG: hypothetical protein P4N59_16690 [Negativicutes bacterium]|nr:hypothetical protein [Negativicutes bacterium]
MKKTAIRLALAAIICLTTALPVFAEAPAQTLAGLKSFAIEGVGTASLSGNIVFASAVGTETMKNMETQYDLTATADGNSHYARLLVYKDGRDMGPALALVDLVEFKPELVALMSSTGQKLLTRKMEENGAKLLEWLPPSKISVQKHNGVQFGSRFILAEKFPIPMYATVAVYPGDGKLTGIALMCPDSDRTYWQPVFTQLITSLVAN